MGRKQANMMEPPSQNPRPGTSHHPKTMGWGGRWSKNSFSLRRANSSIFNQLEVHRTKHTGQLKMKTALFAFHVLIVILIITVSNIGNSTAARSRTNHIEQDLAFIAKIYGLIPRYFLPEQLSRSASFKQSDEMGSTNAAILFGFSAIFISVGSYLTGGLIGW